MELHRVFIASFMLMIHLVQAQDQTGFISLDCGLVHDKSPHKDSLTGLIYSSDDGLVQGIRKVGRIETKFEKYCTEPYWTMRYFPDGVRNCYTLNVTQDTRYLIKATFVYGNYDRRDDQPKFDLYLGPNIWTTVTNDEHHIIKEIIHVTKSDTIQICLVKTGESIPFINTLELRPLKKDMYATRSGSVKSLFRASLSNSTSMMSRIRYPNDVYDREWHSVFEKEWTLVTTTSKVNTSNGYDIPQDVMSKGATSLNSGVGMNITWLVDSPTKEIYIFLHFAELQAPDTREFYFRTWTIRPTDGPYIPRFLEVTTINITELSQCGGGMCTLEVVNISTSKLPPLISAIEVFTEMDLPQLETNGDDVVAIKNILSTYGLSNDSWQGDPCVPKKFLWRGVKCSDSDNSNPPMITSLNLSSTGLNGTIALTIQDLTNLRELDLSNNNLVGSVPEFLADMKLLLVINLSGNNLTGQVPQKLIKKKLLKLNVEGNSEIHCTVGSCVNKGGEGVHKKKNFILWVVASIAFVIVFIVALILFLIIRKKNPLNGKALEPTPRSSEPDITTNNKRFTYSEVMKITNNFQRILGKGGFGTVYYGSLNGTKEVAVKMLSHSSSQGYKQFKAEVELLLRVHHKNLVSLVGYCDERDELALIYEYMANGNLDQHMSGKRGGSFLSWETRLKVAAESAQGLEYLHNGCKPLMVHRDIKTTNILLNEHFEAKLADFGLSRTFPTEDNTHVSTVVAGTIGYIDPEYYRTNWLTEKSDVFSFGIVLLEIITNQPVIDQKREKPHIAEWVGLMLTKGDIESIIDSNLHGDYDSGSVWKVVEVAMMCVNPSSAKRPTMTQVLFELNECLASRESEGSRKIDSQSSIEVSITYGTEVNPTAR